jgi:VanZ family protein
MRLLRLVPVLSVMGLIFFLSSLPGSQVPALKFPGSDKLLHAAAYAVLAAAALFAVPDSLRRGKPFCSALLVFFFSCLYGLSDELHQSFVPGRDASLPDAAADAAGAALAVSAWLAAEARQRSCAKPAAGQPD